MSAVFVLVLWEGDFFQNERVLTKELRDDDIIADHDFDGFGLLCEDDIDGVVVSWSWVFLRIVGAAEIWLGDDLSDGAFVEDGVLKENLLVCEDVSSSIFVLKDGA